MRRCDNCYTPLPGRRSHGFVVGSRLLCGRDKVTRTVFVKGERRLKTVPQPGCRA